MTKFGNLLWFDKPCITLVAMKNFRIKIEQFKEFWRRRIFLPEHKYSWINSVLMQKTKIYYYIIIFVQLWLNKVNFLFQPGSLMPPLNKNYLLLFWEITFVSYLRLYGWDICKKTIKTFIFNVKRFNILIHSKHNQITKI